MMDGWTRAGQQRHDTQDMQKEGNTPTGDDERDTGHGRHEQTRHNKQKKESKEISKATAKEIN